MQHNKPEPPMSSHSTAHSRLFSVAERWRPAAHRHEVREAARFVFCVYHGIPVRGIREENGELVVQFDADYIGVQASGMSEYVEMLVSGAIAVQIIYGGENREMVDAIIEAERIYQLREVGTFAGTGGFESLVHKASRHATLHLADPKMRSAIASATRFLTRMRRSVSSEDMEQLRQLVIRALH